MCFTYKDLAPQVAHLIPHRQAELNEVDAINGGIWGTQSEGCSHGGLEVGLGGSSHDL